MRFEFDPAKLATNVAKHGVWFSAADDFAWKSRRSKSTTSRKSYGESRLCATGLVGTRLLVLVFTLRESAVRIISLRKANQREVRRYVRNA